MSDADAANPHNVTTLRQTETLREHDHPEKAHADRQLQHQQGERWYVGEDVLGDHGGSAPARRSQHERSNGAEFSCPFRLWRAPRLRSRRGATGSR